MDPRLSDEGGFRLRTAIVVFLHSKWIILACVIGGLAAAKFYVQRTERVYQAAARLRIDEKRPNLPDIFQTMQRGSDVGTDIQVLGSRTLAEAAVRQLAAQVRLLKPRISRDNLLDDIRVDDEADWGEYQLVARGDGSFAVLTNAGKSLAVTRPGEQVQLNGITFRLKPAAAKYDELRIRVTPLRDAVDELDGGLSAYRVSEDADVIVVRYLDTDRGLVWQVPNVVADRFIETRRESDKTEARSQVKFLREQIDTILRQLSESEEELKRFRERARVVNPSEEANSQISRLVQLEAQRSSLEAERSALAKLMASVRQQQAHRVSGTPSAYRQLLAFPTLLRSQAASQLMSSLAQVEDQRAQLLARRTEADPDVQLLTARISDLEQQLATTATTYLEGLNNQLTSLDSTASRFSSELRSLPERELEYARLDRKPSVLKDMYTLLQTRLKEAEIAQAVDNATITIVDRAIPPMWPIKPKPGIITGAGLFAGLLLGVGLALVREYADRTVRTRADVVAVSGLPVVGVVPRMPRRNVLLAVVAKRSTPMALPEPPPAGLTNLPSRRLRPNYTFLSAASEEGPRKTARAESLPPGSVARPRAHVTMAGLGTTLAEAYGILQTNIAFSRPEVPIKVLALTSPLPGEGKTTTVVNLALTLSERGLSVCLIDADLRRGRVHELFGLSKEPGLPEVLLDTVSFEVACHQVQVGDTRMLTVVTAGSTVTSPPGLIGSARMRDLLGQLRERFDLVLLDTPPVNILTDAALIGVNADGVVLVVRAGTTDTAALGYAMEQLNHVRAPALGVVLNDVDLRRFASYDDAYRYTADESYLGTPSDTRA